VKSKIAGIFLIVLILCCLAACNLPATIKNSLAGAFPGIQDNPVWQEFSIEPTSQPQVIVVPNESEGLEVEILSRPVRFTNSGTHPYTVQVETYAAADGTASLPSDASTAVFPGSSGYLSLPLGTYTWCYYWDIGDVNGDNVTDYHHAIDARPVVLDANDSDALEFAETVNLAAPPASGEEEGPCANAGSSNQTLSTAYPTATREIENPMETEAPQGSYEAFMGFRNWHGEWFVKIVNGKVVEGYTVDYSWYVQEGTYDFETLYLSVKKTEPGTDACNNSFEVWFEFTDEGMSHVQTVDGCGRISTEPQIVPFNIFYNWN